MTGREALWYIKVVLQDNEQSREAIETLEQAVFIAEEVIGQKTYTLEEAKRKLNLDDMGTEANHIRNFFDNGGHDTPKYVLDDWDDPKIDK